MKIGNYKPFKIKGFALFKDPNKLQPRNTNDVNDDIVETIKKLFSSKEQKNYKLMEESILKLTEVFELLPQGLYDAISAFPIVDSLIHATYIPEIKREYAFQCISNLIDVQTEIYQNQFSQYQNFINDLFKEIADYESDDVYYCILLIYKLVEAFQSNKEYFITNLNIVSLGYFSMEDNENAILCLNLMKKIVKFIKGDDVPIHVKDDILKMFIQISKDIFSEYNSSDLSIINEVLDFCNEMIDNHFLSVIPVYPLIEKIFNKIDPNSPLIFTALNYYIIVISKGINQKINEDEPRFLEITKQIISEANIREIIVWVQESSLSSYSCHAGYRFLSYLIQNQNLLEINIVDIIDESGILGAAYQNILDCQFKQKTIFLIFFLTFIDKADSETITNDGNSNMFFNLFDFLFQQPFDKKGMIEIVDTFAQYLTKFQIHRSDDDMLSVSEAFDFIDQLVDMKSVDEYSEDDTFIGKIDTIIGFLQNLK